MDGIRPADIVPWALKNCFPHAPRCLGDRADRSGLRAPLAAHILLCLLRDAVWNADPLVCKGLGWRYNA